MNRRSKDGGPAPRILARSGLSVLVALPLGAACQRDPHLCGDGFANGTEDCDDECTTLLDRWDQPAWFKSVHVTPDGRVLIAGCMSAGIGEYDAWVRAFDVEGTPLWARDFGPGCAWSIHPRGDGFAFLHEHDDDDVDMVSLDAAGNVVETIAVLDTASWNPAPKDWIDTASGLLIGGADSYGDFWLRRIDDNGVIETLVREDHAGFYDSFQRLRRYGDVIGALVDVGTHIYPAADSPFPHGTVLLVEYDEAGVELRRTLLEPPDQSISWRGVDLDVTADGIWILVGEQEDADGTHGWAAAVQAGEPLWTFESQSAADGDNSISASFETAQATDDTVLAGWVHTATKDTRTWAVRVDSGTGELLTDLVGPPLPGVQKGSRYYGSGTTSDGRVWLVGDTVHSENHAETRICEFSN